MSEREDYELDRGAPARADLSLGMGRRYEADEGARRARRGLAWLGVGLLLALAVAALVFLWDRRSPEELAAPAAVERAPAAPPTTTARADTRPLPALDGSDAFVRELIAGLSRHPQLAAWLAGDELARRFVAAVASFAEGRSPGEHLPLLRPAEPFAVAERGDRMVVDPVVYRRYDLLAAVVDSLDTAGTAELYRRLEPLFDQAYRELGFPDGRFRDVAEPAIARLRSVEALDQPAELVAAPAGYRFADPSLEGLDGASKQLLRLGPSNLSRIQTKVAAVAAAAGLDPGP